MREVRTQELFDVLMDAGAVPEPLARGFFVAAVGGFRHMHANGVAHRDIKLENMMITHGTPPRSNCGHQGTPGSGGQR